MLGIPTIPVVTQTLTAATSFVTLYYASPGGTPRHLVIRVNATHDSQDDGVYLRFNGDGTSNYWKQSIQGTNTTEAYTHSTSADSRLWLCKIDDESNEFGGGEWLVPDAFTTNSDKNVIGVGGVDHDYGLWLTTGRWADTDAITSVTFESTGGTGFGVGSTFEIAVVDEAYIVDEDILTSAGSFDHSGISAADGDLVVIGNLRSTHSSAIEEVSFRLNGDTTSGNYTRQRLNGHQAEVAAYANNTYVFGHCSAANEGDANVFGSLVAQIPNFSDTTTSTDRVIGGFCGGHFSNGSAEIAASMLRWNNTDAVTRVAVAGANTSNFAAKSMLSIYAVPKNQITRTELTGDASSIAFTDIPQTYDHLEVTAFIRDDRSATSDDILMSLTPVSGSNDTTDSNYDTQLFQGAGSTDTATSSGGDRAVGNIPAASETADVFGMVTITLQNYTKTDRHKNSISTSFRGDSATGVYLRANRWENTAAIEAITLTPSAGSNFVAGTVVELRGISATPSTSEIDDVNGIAIANVHAINGVAIGSVQELNDIENVSSGGGGTSYQGITWSTGDNIPVGSQNVLMCGKVGAALYVNAGLASPLSYEHDGSSWSGSTGTGGAKHSSAQGGGSQGAAVIYGGYDGSDSASTTDEYDGSTWSTVNSMAGETAYATGGGEVQASQFATGGSNYGPTVRDIKLTQTYNGTTWTNESVDSNGAGSGTGQNAGGGGLDACLSASGALDADWGGSFRTAANLFSKTAGSWTAKSSVSVGLAYCTSSSDGTRVYKIAGYGPPGGAYSGSNMRDVVESWVDDSWSTENVLPRKTIVAGWGGGGLQSTGQAFQAGGSYWDGSKNDDSNQYFTAAATS